MNLEKLKSSILQKTNDWPVTRDFQPSAILTQLQKRLGNTLPGGIGADAISEMLANNDLPVDSFCSRAQLDALQNCVELIVRESVPGDLIDVGCGRGGQCVLMSGVLKALGALDRKIFAADSFQGLPNPDPDDSPDDVIVFEVLKHIGLFRTSLEQFRETLGKYGLLDGRVQPIPGWFHESLLRLPTSNLSLIRLDATFYQSTRDALELLYPQLSRGGFVFVADYHVPTGARRAVDEFRLASGIEDPLGEIGHQSVCWRNTVNQLDDPVIE